ncbi:MAG: hypothetical protein ACJ8R9_09035 [Steroidobacteraceae bacterium]
MKIIYVTATAILIAACSTHPVRCRGPLQPINKPAAAASGPKAAPAEVRP